jgi:peptidoglycan/LPS O-acetylase OafA/YrhL
MDTHTNINAATRMQQRLPGLDAVRALAILTVMFYHLNIPGFFDAGFLGVDIFFNLSGFLITSLLVNEYCQHQRIQIGRFYQRRFVRLFPAFAALILACLVLVPLLMPQALHRFRSDLGSALVYLSNWWQIFSDQSYFENFGKIPILQHLWSLAVEEQFYLVWPLFLLGMLRLLGPRGAGWASFALAGASTLWMAYLYLDHGQGDPNRVYLGSDTHSMGLFLGAGFACFWNPWHARAVDFRWMRSRWMGVLGLLALLALASMLWVWNEAQPVLYTGGFLAASVASVVLIYLGCAGTSQQTALPWLVHRAGAFSSWLGTRSYSMYLWHWPVFIYLKGELPPTWSVALQCLAVTAVAAELSYRWVEIPFKSLRMSQLVWIGPGLVASVVGFSAYIILSIPMSPDSAPTTVSQGLPQAPSSTPDAKALALSVECAMPEGHTASDDQSASAPPEEGDDKRIVAIGDSVMLATRNYMQRAIPGMKVDAEVGRQASKSVELVHHYKENNQNLESVVIHLGTNGYVVESHLRRLLDELTACKHVLVINIYANRRWTDANNATIARVVKDYANSKVIDWNDIGTQHLNYFVKDGIHLTHAGIENYVHEIGAGLGVTLVDVKPTSAAKQTTKGRGNTCVDAGARSAQRG